MVKMQCKNPVLCSISQTDWNDGSALCELINKLGGSVDMNALSRLPHEFENNCFRGIMAANTQLGIPKYVDTP